MFGLARSVAPVWRASAVASSSRLPMLSVIPSLSTNSHPFSTSAAVARVYKPPPSKKWKIKAERIKNKRRLESKLEGQTVPDVVLPASDAVALLRAVEVCSARHAVVAVLGMRPYREDYEKMGAKEQDRLKARMGHNSIRGRVVLPRNPDASKTLKILVFADDRESIKVAQEEGCAYIGGPELFEAVLAEEIKPDKVLATPSLMQKLSPLNRFLGRQGLFPTAKRGTVAEGDELRDAIRESKGALDWISNKDGEIKITIGKADWPTQEILSNLEVLRRSIKDQYNSQFKTNGSDEADREITGIAKKANELPAIYWTQLSSSFGPMLKVIT